MAWDGTGERLAVTYSGAVDATYSGLVAVFDTRQTPIVSTSLL
jgi:aladin